MNTFDTIILQKYKDIDAARKEIPSLELETSVFFNRHCISLKNALTKKGASGVIAEFKRASLSNENIQADPPLKTIIEGFVNAGVSAISVATDSHKFKGSGMDLVETREMIACPVIRRDFILDEYQIMEAKAMGADVIQLMAVILTPFEIGRLAAIAQVLGLEVILEVRSKKELKDSLTRNIDVVSVNNRRASDLRVDLNTSIELAKYIPDHLVRMSEGGIKTPEDVQKLADTGYLGFLIGERFMKEENPAEACKTFIENLRMKPTNV